MRLQGRLKRMAEKASRGVTLRRRLPSGFGGASILVTPESMLRLWGTHLEQADPLLFAFARKFVTRGDVVWDVGANVGLFSFASSWMSGSLGSVFCFEPDNWLASMLQRSAIQLPPGYASVSVLSVAIADHADIAQLAIGDAGRASNHLDGWASHRRKQRTSLVPTVTLDWLMERLPTPTVLKIDVEGAEAGVLRGAVHLLRECQPLILCEVTEGNSEIVTSMLQGCGYSLFGQEGDRIVPRTTFNTIAIPEHLRHFSDAMLRN